MRAKRVRCKKNIVALTYIFPPTLKKWYTLQKTDKENITSFQTGLYNYHFEGHLSFQYRNPSHVGFSTWDNFLEHL